MDNVKKVEASSFCAFVIRQDGTIWSWGSNFLTGQLGNGNVTNQKFPKRIDLLFQRD